MHRFQKCPKSIDLNSVGKVDESETSEDDRKKFCLSDEQIIQLCKIGLFLERFHENERDIEWAIYKVKSNNSMLAICV